MREILFRGKSRNTGKWYQGDLVTVAHKRFIDDDIVKERVIPETVGQYTGLTDKNGTKIFEGDIVKVQDDILGSPFCDGITGKIVYDECAFFIEPENPMNSQWLYDECAEYEVIGNIHDNPELMKGGEGNDK